LTKESSREGKMKGKAKEKGKKGSELYANTPISREDPMNHTAILLLSDMTDNSTIATVDLLLSSSI
jgi:hypothetical protein